MNDAKLPPVTQIAVASFALVIASGIWIASHLPKHVPIGPPIVLIVLSALLIAMNVVLLSRVPGFEWDRFFAVAKWSFLAYAIISGLLAFVFIHDGTRGGELVVLLLSLVIFAVHVPLLIGWTVARYPEVYEE